MESSKPYCFLPSSILPCFISSFLSLSVSVSLFLEQAVNHLPSGAKGTVHSPSTNRAGHARKQAGSGPRPSGDPAAHQPQHHVTGFFAQAKDIVLIP